MAMVHKSSPFFGACGQLGDLTFKTERGKTTVWRMPVKRAMSTTMQQAMIKIQLAKPARYARSAIQDPDVKHLYEQAADGLRTVYNIAVADAISCPVIRNIHVKGYKGTPADKIIVEAIDDFKVKSVIVTIYKSNGGLLEIGLAEKEADDLYWCYTPKVINKKYRGCLIRATAIDLPGNEGIQD